MEVTRQLPAPAFCTLNRSGNFAEKEYRLQEIEPRFFGRPAHSLLITHNELRHYLFARICLQQPAVCVRI
jgi:hypothetical protein